MTMNEITSRVGRWLAESNIPLKGVKIILEFPDRNSLYRAEMTIKRELTHAMHYRVRPNFGEIETMNGLGLTLRVAPQIAPQKDVAGSDIQE